MTALKDYPSKLPVIVERHNHKANTLGSMENCKYLFPKTFSIAEVGVVIRKKLDVNRYQSIFLSSNGVLLQSKMSLPEVYEKYKQSDGFLYITYI
jgi:GABA(A) receptor-associated protein